MPGLYSTIDEVDIDQRIQFIEYYIDVIRTDARGDHGEAFFADVTGMRNKLAVLAGMFDGIEMLTYETYPVGVANGNNSGSQFLRPEVEVINGAALIDDKLRFLDFLQKLLL